MMAPFHFSIPVSQWRNMHYTGLLMKLNAAIIHVINYTFNIDTFLLWKSSVCTEQVHNTYSKHSFSNVLLLCVQHLNASSCLHEDQQVQIYRSQKQTPCESWIVNSIHIWQVIITVSGKAIPIIYFWFIHQTILFCFSVDQQVALPGRLWHSVRWRLWQISPRGLTVPPSSPHTDSQKTEEMSWAKSSSHQSSSFSWHVLHVAFLCILCTHAQTTELSFSCWHLRRRETDIMGASSSGLLDEAKITHIKGKTKRSLLLLQYSLVSSAALDYSLKCFRRPLMAQLSYMLALFKYEFSIENKVDEWRGRRREQRMNDSVTCSQHRGISSCWSSSISSSCSTYTCIYCRRSNRSGKCCSLPSAVCHHFCPHMPH